MATQCTSDAFPLAGLGRRHVVAKFDGGRLSSDGGAVLLRAANQAFQVLFFSLFQWILPNYSMNSSGRCSNWFTTAGENWGRVKAL